MRICSGPGCLRAVPDDRRFCDECKAGTQYSSDDIRTHSAGNTDRERYQSLYGSKRFKVGIQPRVLQRDPVCKRCNRLPSEIADHIVPAGEAIRQVQESKRFPFDTNAGFFLMSNLQGLCRSCHGFKTNEDKAHVGEWPSVLDAYDAMPKRQWTF